jgi:hypothetical protein
MTDWYNHPDARNIPDVTKAQGAILAGDEKKPKPDGDGAIPTLTLVRLPKQNNPEQKRA